MARSEQRGSAPRTFRRASTASVKRSGNLRFACKHCAVCCRVFHVNVTDADIKRIALATGLLPADFVALQPASDFESEENEDALKNIGGNCITLLRRKAGRCIFVTEDRRCLIHEWRPIGCRLFPFEVDDGHLSIASHAVGVCKGLGGSGIVRAADCLATWKQSCREDKEYERKVVDWNRLVSQRRVKPHRDRFIEFLLIPNQPKDPANRPCDPQRNERGRYPPITRLMRSP